MADGNESNRWPGGPAPNRGPGGYADPRNSGAPAGQPPWDQPASPWDQPQPVQPVQPPWGGSDPARARGPQRPDPRYADPQRPDPRYTDPRHTDPRYADPRHTDPRNSAAGAQDQEQRARNPRREPGQRGRMADGGPDQGGWMADGGLDDQARQFRGEAPEDPYPVPPGGRHRTDSPDDYAGHAGPGERRGPGRTMTYVGGGALVAILLVGAGLGLSRGGGGSPASTATPTEAVKPNPSAAAQSGPGTPAVTARSLGGQQVEFSWSYANPASGDTFRVRNGGGQPTTVDKPDLVLSVAQGSKACIQVQVIAASGTASAESNQACSPS
jgi:hypothetical protein